MMLRRLLLTLLFLSLPLLAQTAPAPAPAAPDPDAVATLEPKNFSSLWVDKTATVAPEAVVATIDGLRKQQSDPEHIVVFIHGFDVKRDSSTEEFDGLASRLETEFKPSGKRVAYAGLQWESIADGSIFNLPAQYFDKIPLARSVGRGPGRQLMLAIHQAFPKARVSFMAHSMGCEVAAAALSPELIYADAQPFVETYDGQSDVKILMGVLCGSDLDYDIWSKGKAEVRDRNERVHLLWSTVAPFSGEGDEVLNLRGRVRGRAGGSAFPLLTLQQLDTVLTHRRVIFDGEDIPEDHHFSKYYDEARLKRIVPTLLYIDAPKPPMPTEMAEIEDIMSAPNDLNSLLPYLDGPLYGSRYYALWRLERLNCGDARHMSDGTLEKIARLLKTKPQRVWREAPKSECLTVKNEQFPTEKMMTKAGAPPWARKR
jgi:hypothetical protein